VSLVKKLVLIISGGACCTIGKEVGDDKCVCVCVCERERERERERNLVIQVKPKQLGLLNVWA
jgi:hypothetical protein